MKRMWKTLVCTAALAVAIAPAAAAKTKVSFWNTYSETENKVFMDQVVPAFEKANPDLEVEVVRLGYDELRDKLVTSAAAGAGPDVARIDIIWTPGFAASGLLEPLNSYKGFSDLMKQVFPGPLSTNKLGSDYYGLPFDTNTQVYIYNNSLFQNAGVTAPKTWADFTTVSKRLTKVQDGKTTTYGYEMGGASNWSLLPWIWSNGGSVTDDAMATATGHLDGDKTVGALNQIVDWNMTGILAPNITGAGMDTWGAFTKGETAARQDGPWFAKFLEDNASTMDVGYALIPAGAGAQSSSVVGGEDVVMMRNSKNKDAAWRFTQFLLSNQAQVAMAAAGQMPVIRSAAQVPEFRKSKYYPVYLEQLLTAQARTPHPKYSEIETAMQTAFADILSGKNSAKTALGEAARQVNALLKK